VIQPRIQSRAVELDPFLIVVAAIFGGTLIGIVGALVAIPFAAALQIAVREYLSFRTSASDVLLPPGADLGKGPDRPSDPLAPEFDPDAG
ncbi:MAG: AI-2E family transporter, partial [Thermomicrobiales bacterium]